MGNEQPIFDDKYVHDTETDGEQATASSQKGNKTIKQEDPLLSAEDIRRYGTGKPRRVVIRGKIT